MRVNFSISLKLTLMVVLLSTIIILSLLFLNLTMQDDRENQIYDDTSKWAAGNFARSHSALKSMEVELSDYERFNNTKNLSKFILEIVSNNTEILQININTPTQNGLIIKISTDNNSVGTTPNEYKYNSNSYKNGDTYYIINKTKPILTIVSPVNISGDVIGTYEIIISMYPTLGPDETQIQLIVIIAFASIFILILSNLYLLRRSIVKPITKFRDTAEVIGKGNLDTKIEIKSRDELGELASAFNKMAEDLKKSRSKIEEYNKILENLLNRKDEFIGQLGHDLKNPLQPLVGLLPMLIEQEKDPKIKEALDIMNKNAIYMRDLIFDTLQLAKLRSETIEFDIQDQNLKEIVEDVIDTQKLLLEGNKIEIDSKIDKNIIVQADKLRLVEIFKNLITNSVKYTPDSGGKITIDAKKEKNTVTVSIKDTGIGMTKEQLSHIFDEFYKADKFSSEYTSTGLGLAICKRIVEKHGGRIWVESPGPGKGSAFYFTLKSKAKNN